MNLIRLKCGVSQDWSLLWIAFQWSHAAATMPGATYDDNITESTVTMEFAMCLHN